MSIRLDKGGEDKMIYLLIGTIGIFCFFFGFLFGETWAEIKYKKEGGINAT